MIEFTFTLKKDAADPLYVQLYRYIKHAVQNRKIAADTRLPSVRKLSQHLKVGKNTVETAYHQLLAEGYIESRPRSGYYTCCLDDSLALRAGMRPEVHPPALRKSTLPCHYDFRYGQIDPEQFPAKTWRRLVIKSISPEDASLYDYGDRQGEYGLRMEIAKYIYPARGAACSPEQIIVTAGTQQALDLICKLTRSSNKRAAVEDPGYAGGRLILESNGLELRPIPLTASGINLEKLAESQAQMVLVSPSRQFPYGISMPISKRLALLNWAEKTGALIIENDYEGEFGYNSRPIPALQGLDQNGNVVYLYTFSNSFLPSIRISFIILPEPLLKRYHDHFAILEQSVSRMQQKTLQFFMAEGYWERHIRKMKKLYKRKCQLLIDSLSLCLGDRAEVVGSSAGMHLLLRVKNGMGEAELIEKAWEAGVKIYPVSNLWMYPSDAEESLILLGFGGMKEDQMAQGVRLLKKAWSV